jgi:fructose transport system permease protein
MSPFFSQSDRKSGETQIMTEQKTRAPSGADFEAGLAAADKSVASFARDDKTIGYVLRGILRRNPTIIPATVLLISVICFGIIAPNFMSPGVLSLVLKQVTVTGVVAIAQTLIILTAGIDLSVGAIMVLSSMIMGRLAVDFGIPPIFAVTISMFFGALMGWLNGFLVTFVKLPPFIVTLGTLSVFTALLLWYSGSQSIRGADIREIAPSILFFGQSLRFGGFVLTYGGMALIVLALVVWYLLNQTAWGRHVHAIGDDPDAAMLSGINLNRTLISVYALAGLICAFAGWVAAGRVGSISPIGFSDINLASITAVVIGGTSLFGGRGSILGSVLGAMIVGVFNTGLSLAGVDDYWQMFAAGNLVLIAVALDQWLRRATK